jgi:hypothetical protein
MRAVSMQKPLGREQKVPQGRGFQQPQGAVG